MFNYCPFCGEHIDHVVEHFTCDNCGKTFYQNSKPTATIIPLYNKSEILVAVRAQEPQKGKLDMIGGFLNNGEDPLDGAVREMEEETGYIVKKEDLQFFNILIDRYLFEGVEYYVFNVNYLLYLDHKPKMKALDDVAELKWISLKDPVRFAFKSQDTVLTLLRDTMNNN